VTGNDIVDLSVAAIESNRKRKGFLEKIFTLQEQQYIRLSAAPNEMVWRLWTMKESAYKLYTRQYGGRFFAPQKFSCNLLTAISGTVEYENNIYQTNSKITNSYIHTVAKTVNSEKAKTIVACFALPVKQPKAQQKLIYKRIINRYHSAFGDFNRNVSVAKDENGIPFLYCGNNLQIPVSITHHGNFAAFTIY
jgi:phosphopantetheinyl transferase (holo-ACP synthase)